MALPLCCRRRRQPAEEPIISPVQHCIQLRLALCFASVCRKFELTLSNGIAASDNYLAAALTEAILLLAR